MLYIIIIEASNLFFKLPQLNLFDDTTDFQQLLSTIVQFRFL